MKSHDNYYLYQHLGRLTTYMYNNGARVTQSFLKVIYSSPICLLNVLIYCFDVKHESIQGILVAGIILFTLDANSDLTINMAYTFLVNYLYHLSICQSQTVTNFLLQVCIKI